MSLPHVCGSLEGAAMGAQLHAMYLKGSWLAHEARTASGRLCRSTYYLRSLGIH